VANVSNPKGKSAAHRSFVKKKNPAIDRLNTRQHGEGSLAAEGKGYQPEIEHSKLGDAVKKKKKKDDSKYPPHLRGDAIGKMRKAFAHTNEEVFGEEGYDHWRDKQLERGTWKGGGGSSSGSSGKKTKGKTVYQKQAEKEHGKGVTALDIVKKNIEKKHGKGAIMSTKKESFVLKSFKQVVDEEAVTAAVLATKAAVVGAKAAKVGAVAAKGAAAVKGGAGAAAGATKAVGGAAAKKASVAGTTAGSSSKTAGFGQRLGKAAKEGAKDAAVDHVQKGVRKAAGPKEEDTNEETLHEISADTALAASKEADKKRGKLAHAGDKEGAKKKNAQAVRLYKASAAKRKTETSEGTSYGLYKGDGKPKGAMKDYLDKKAKKLSDEKKKQKPEYKNNPAFGDSSHHSNAKSKNEEYTVTNADKKGNTPAWQGYKSGKKNAKTGKPLYKAADHVKEGHWEYHEKEGLKKFSDFIQEGNPTTRMMQKSKSQQTGNISADRGTDAKKNKESRKGLEKDLKKKGIGYKKGVGEYKYDDGSKGREVSYQTSPAKGMSKRRFGKVMRRLGRKHGQESVITKDKDKPARLHDTESKKPKPSEKLGKTKPGKHPKGYGETSGTKVRSKNLSNKTNKPSYHYG
tara:strand:- start:1212 stop:3095 length:1884 start_codon:yes stop_codon:yes gene_type:complete